MTLNKFMHHKNLYKKKQPNFKELAIKYEEFRRHTTQDEAGKVHIDFKDAQALKALTWALLKDDFDLDVHLPLDRLIPTIPLRLNYILWLADIIGKRKKSVVGIDVGCGASCVYPLLAAKVQKWSFFATESDDLNYEFAKRNVEKNSLTEKITIVKVENKGDIFQGLDAGKKYDFTMCNPPFFGSNLEAYAMTKTRNPDRSEPHSVSTASEAESITPGGEVEFVRKMISESLNLKDQIRVFTSMLGKKSSVGILKEDLRKNGIKNFGSYEFCQGRTMRWGLGWSFHEKVIFPKSAFQQSKTPEKVPLVISVDRKIQCAKYEIQPLGSWLMHVLKEFGLKYTVIMDCEAMWSATVTAVENTWSHQRRKRRALKRGDSIPAKRLSPGSSPVLDLSRNSEKSENGEDGNEAGLSKASKEEHTGGISEAIAVDHSMNGYSATSAQNIETAVSLQNPSTAENVAENDVFESITASTNNGTTCTQVKIDTKPNSGCIDENPSTSENVTEKKKSNDDAPVLFSAWFTFKFADDESINLEIKWLKGQDKEAMHQVMQLVKNRLRMTGSH